MEEFLKYLNKVKNEWLDDQLKVELELELETEVLEYLKELAQQQGISLDFLIAAMLSYQIKEN